MRRALLTFLIALLPISGYAMRVDNFVLLDHEGDAHELYYHGDASAVVIMVQGNGCPIVRNALTDYKALRDQYQDQGVEFLMLNSNLQDNRASIKKEADEWAIDFPILVDETQLIGESLNLIRTAEVLVIDPKGWQIVYRGPLNDRLDYERQRNEANEHYAAKALDAVLSGEAQAIEVAQRDSIGCLINFPERNQQHAAISYSKTIAPLLQENCVVCHQEGGIGPWAMSDYNMVRGFAPMMREVLRTKRMPPWHADPHIGTFKDDRSLSNEELQTLVHWIEAGAPRGEGPDLLALADNRAVDWPLGEPDLIINIPAAEVPATGVVDYTFPVVKNPLDYDVWVVAAALVPGDRNVVHHILVGSTESDDVEDQAERGFDNYLHGYAPGNESAEMPEGTGVFVKAGGNYQFQMHYTPYGKATVDESKLGLYFADTPPANFLRQTVAVNPMIKIPANDPAHQEQAYITFDKDAILYSLVPHSHYRGRSSNFELKYPDGTSEIILSVPNYDFNWQRTYHFVEPLAMPAGTKLIHRTVYDNSVRNPANPDPTREVPWGLQSWDEMLYGAVQYAWVDERSDAPIHDQQLSETYQFIGFMDKDMDGKLVWSELPRDMKKRLVQGFKAVDKNGDGGLDAEEFLAMRRDGEKRKPEAAAGAGGE
ncbi:MAG: redoxin domain-containing protein [Gammaproteobacteria bacterium]|nr:redoxin domain-containing protein [Gammaproteobacteria bacterium]